MADSKPYSSGSQWRKWDLHVHSPLSVLNNQFPKLDNGEPDWDAYLEKLESLEDIKVLGITDYFYLDGYKKIKSFKDQGRLQNIDAIFPNIEFRLNIIISERRLNFHVIFSDELDPDLIEEQFLGAVNFNFENNPQESSETRSIDKTNLTELGERLIREHEDFSDRDPLELGVSSAVVDYLQISNKLAEDSRFKGKYLLVLPSELTNLIDWNGQDHHTRKSLLQQSDMVFSSNAKTISWCLGEDPYTEGKNKFIEEFKTLKPCIHGSDAHDIRGIGNHCALRGEQAHDCYSTTGDECEQRLCWIKADPTFEGLKQLLYEPSERVKIQEHNPTPIRGDYTFAEVAIKEKQINSTLTISESRLKLNSNLVAVAGGKGAGKTALVDLIANCYIDRVNSNDNNSFVQRIRDQAPELKTILKFVGRDSFEKELEENIFVEDGKISYIAQSELEDYIGDSSDLSEYINNLIFDSPSIRNSSLKHQFITHKEDIDELEGNINITTSKIVTLEDETSEELMSNLQLEAKRSQAAIKDIKKKIIDTEKKLTKENIDIAKEKQEKLATLKETKDRLADLKVKVREIGQFLSEDIPRTNVAIAGINTLITELQLGDPIPEVEFNFEQEVFEKKLKLINDRLSKTVGEIDVLQKGVLDLRSDVQSHTKLLDDQRDLEEKLKKDKELIKEIEQKRQAISEEKSLRLTLFRSLITTVLEQRENYKQIIKEFSSEKGNILSDLTFNADIDFDIDLFTTTANDIFDNRSIKDDKNEEFDSIITAFMELKTGDESKIDEIIQEVERITEEYRGKLKRSVAVNVSDFYDFIFRNYLLVKPVVQYKLTELQKLSLGQKATVLIKIYLAQGDSPIIIDSHDDHLDNEFIMGELVDAIRDAKLLRQIILVSNNGNVVINSDAEQIIIAERNETQISYVTGSIENPLIRDRALQILEGGESAFRQRQNKYRISSRST